MKKIILLVLYFIALNKVYAQGSWTQKSDFGGIARAGAISFSIGSVGYIGLGYDGSGHNDFWAYDPTTDTWSQMADFGGTARWSAVSFVIGNYAYAGTGFDGSLRNDLWRYDPAINSWTQKADFIGAPRYQATGFSIDSKGYIGTGDVGGNSRTTDFWEYDPSLDNWTQKANVGGIPRRNAVGLSIGNFGYIGPGETSIGGTQEFWAYDPSSDSWIQKTDFAGSPRSSASGFVIGNNAFVGTGYDGIATNDFWKYNQVSDSWQQITSLPGNTRFSASAFSIGNKGYIGVGADLVSNMTDFWEYSPTATVTCDNYAVNLDGVDDYLSIGDSAVYDMFGANQASTFTCYFKLDSLLSSGAAISMVAKGAHSATTGLGNKYLALEYQNVGTPHLIFFLYDLPIENRVESDPSFLLTAGTWYEVTVVRDANIKMYINGIDVTYNPVNTGWSHDYNAVLSGTDTYFGLRHNVGPGEVDGNFWKGKLDEIRFWNRALSQSEIQNRYNRELIPVAETGLLGYWKFNENTGLTTYNATLNNVDAILYNGTQWTSDAPFNSGIITDTINGLAQVVTGATSSYSLQSQNGLSYVWQVLNGAIISGQGTDSINVLWNSSIGTGWVTVTASNGSCDYTDTLDIEIGTTGMNDQSVDNSFSIFPNPSSGQIFINFNETLNPHMRFEIWNLVGEKIMESGNSVGSPLKTDAGYSLQLDVGVYIVRMSNGILSEGKKIVVLK
ncbi:MAG: T9SS type A sorting domain-containing protein [Bacteroidia bacterium]|nr:T9SS type A sorting domain-containing protein [Bacteroidia bacterium]